LIATRTRTTVHSTPSATLVFAVSIRNVCPRWTVSFGSISRLSVQLLSQLYFRR